MGEISQTDACTLMGVLWLSARAEYILKCNMIPSLLLLFLPSWLIFTVFKGMLSLSVLPSGPRVSSRALVSLCSHHSLSCTSPQIISPVSLNVSPQPLGHTCHSAACSLLTLLMPPAPDLSSAQCFPRPSPLDAVLSIALQPVSTPAACPVLSCPELSQSIGSLFCGPSLPSPIQPSFPPPGWSVLSHCTP